MANAQGFDRAVAARVGALARRATGLARGAALVQGLPAGFDAGLYLALNPDVAAAGVDPARHYLRYGRAELRRLLPAGHRLDHPSSRALTPREREDWQAALGARAARIDGGLPALIRSHPRAGWLYAGFTLSAYLVAQPALAATLDDPLYGAFHYLEFGLETGGFCYPAELCPATLAALYGQGAGAPAAVLRRLLDAGHTPFDITLTEAGLWARHGLPPALAAHFDPLHYQTMAQRRAASGAPQPPDIAPLAQGGAGVARIRLLQHFLTTGRHWRAADGRPLPIHPDLDFDPAFYAGQVATGAGIAADYAHFLRHGLASGLAGDAAMMMAQVLGQPIDPQGAAAIMAALPRYAEAVAKPAPAARPAPPQILSDLLKDPDPAGFAALVAALGDAGPAVRDLLVRMATRLQLPPERAERLCWALLASGVEDHRLLSRLASVVAQRGGGDAATALQARALAARGGDPAAEPWSALALAQGWERAGRTRDAARLLAGLHGAARGDVALAAARDGAAQRLFDGLWSDLGARVARDGVAAVQGDLKAVLAALTPPFGPGPPPRRRIRRVALIGADDIAQCHRYRVLQKAAHLRAAGFQVIRFDPAELAVNFAAALPDLDAAIFCRLPALPPVIAAITAARDHGVLTFYDIDDPLYDAEIFPPDLLTYRGKITKADHDAMACGTVLFEHAAALCDIGLGSTRAIANGLSARVRLTRAEVYPNALDPALYAAKPRRRRVSGAVVTLFYGSATRAHKADFHDLLEPALAQILAAYGPRVRLVLRGDFGPMTAIDPRDPRVDLGPAIPDYAAYLDLLSRADINLSVLRPSPLADTKSAIKWMEAAAFAIPSIVTRTAEHEAMVTDAETGLIVDDAAGFVAALRRLIDDPDLAARIGAAARAAVRRDLSPDAMAARARAILRPFAPPVPRRKRLLVVNVFYPPQAIGGATRVVADTARAFRRKYGADWEVEVICTHNGGTRPYDVALWSDHGIRVHAITAPRQDAGDMTAVDGRMAAVFERLLDRISPDLVHFHCIQRLTAAVVAVTRGRGVPYVITLHDGWWLSDHQFLLDAAGDLATYDYRAGAATPLPERAARLGPLLAGAARVVAVSAGFAALHHRAGLDRVGVLENAGAAAFGHLPRLPPADGRLRLGHLGGTAAIKGLGLLRTALMAGDFANLSLTVVDHARAQGADHHGLWGQTPVRFIPPVPQDRMGQLYAGLDVLVAPSLWPESYGLVAREARAAGLWVIASDRGAMGADLRDGVDGFVVDVGRAGPLMDVLARMNADPARFALAPPCLGPQRSLDDQVAEMAALYAGVLGR